jgi:pseudaminic acid synthase
MTSANQFKIGTREIGPDAPPLIVAELSGNHQGSLDRALAIVDAAADAGAHAIKLQTYTADTMTLDLRDGDFVIGDKKSLWSGRSLYDLYEEAHTPWEWHGPLFDRAKTRGMLAFSTPFDATAVAFLESLDVPCHKVASFECTDLPLLRAIGATRKPVVLSTGMATLAEIEEAIATLRKAGAADVMLLKCTSAYPADPSASNIAAIPHMRAVFGCEVGLSDHTMGIGAAVASVALGASMIEKHVTLSRADGGVDGAFSMEPQELAALVTETERAWRARGVVAFGPSEAEKGSLAFRRSVYAARDIAAGEERTPANIRVIRPSFGLAPRHYPELLGRKATRAIARGTPFAWDMAGPPTFSGKKA